MSKPRYSRSRNPRNGVVYVYEVLESYYDKEKKQSRNKRVLIGKEDPVTKEIIPTLGRGRPRTADKSSQDSTDSTPESSDYKLLYQKYQKAKREAEIASSEGAQAKKDLHEILTLCDDLIDSAADTCSKVEAVTTLSTKFRKRYGV